MKRSIKIQIELSELVETPEMYKSSADSFFDWGLDFKNKGNFSRAKACFATAADLYKMASKQSSIHDYCAEMYYLSKNYLAII